MSDPIKLARAYLSRVAEPPHPVLTELITDVGPVRAADLVRSGAVAVAVARQGNERRAIDLAEADLAQIEALGGRLAVPEDDDWPAWPLSALSLPAVRSRYGRLEPIALWIKGAGRLDDIFSSAIAIVGSRAATDYGLQIATEFAHILATHGVTVVSGAAYGIDAAAHRGAISAGGRTVAVLACGLNVAYPAGNQSLLERASTNGLVISEYPPSTQPARHRFLTRNRLIAALSDGTVVVEAGKRSGAKNTAAFTTALGRLLMAVPGPITSLMSLGCHELLRSGQAVSVANAAEILESTGQLNIEQTLASGP